MDGALNVAIILTGHAYLPEAWAYHRHLAARGWFARVVDDPESAREADLAIAFSLTQQRALQRLGVPAVHEYNSLSAGRWRHVKDAVKRLAAPPAAGRIFSDPHIARRMHFTDGLPVLIRSMGVDAAIFGCLQKAVPTHDIVYCGSFRRAGLADAMIALAQFGWRVIAYGTLEDAHVRQRLESAGVDLPGAITRAQVPAALARARFGLNFTPDVAPLNRQPSVKSLEYAAAGLTIIANRYPWMGGVRADSRDRSAVAGRCHGNGQSWPAQPAAATGRTGWSGLAGMGPVAGPRRVRRFSAAVRPVA